MSMFSHPKTASPGLGVVEGNEPTHFCCSLPPAVDRYVSLLSTGVTVVTVHPAAAESPASLGNKGAETANPSLIGGFHPCCCISWANWATKGASHEKQSTTWAPSPLAWTISEV